MGRIAIGAPTAFVDEPHNGHSDIPRHELQKEIKEDDITFVSSQRGVKPAQFNFPYDHPVERRTRRQHPLFHLFAYQSPLSWRYHSGRL